MLPSAHGPGPRTTPFDGTDRLIIDGTNLLYRLGTGTGGAAPASAIVGRIRGAVPLPITIDLVFDGVGHGVYGRLAQKMVVRYSGRRAADDTILDLVSEATMQGGGPAAADRVLVVTNDRGLRDHLAAKGARTAPLQWFIGKLNVPAPSMTATGSRRPGIGAGRPPGAGAHGGTPRVTRIARAGSPAAARPPSPGRRTRSPATSATRAPRADRARPAGAVSPARADPRLIPASPGPTHLRRLRASC